jgi:hypothetical protein
MINCQQWNYKQLTLQDIRIQDYPLGTLKIYGTSCLIKQEPIFIRLITHEYYLHYKCYILPKFRLKLPLTKVYLKSTARKYSSTN